MKTHWTEDQTVDLKKLRELFDRGLVAGIGDKEQTCIEGAITLACGFELTDRPPCVAGADRIWSITINDAPWSSETVRAETLWPVALAQIGTAGTDRRPWTTRVVEGTIRRVLPIVLRNVAVRHIAARHGEFAVRDVANNTIYRATFHAAAVAAEGARMAFEARDAILREAVAVAVDAYSF